jgi:hypothetical protein
MTNKEKLLTEAMMVLNEKAARQPLLNNPVLNPNNLSQEEIQKLELEYRRQKRQADQIIPKALDKLESAQRPTDEQLTETMMVLNEKNDEDTQPYSPITDVIPTKYGVFIKRDGKYSFIMHYDINPQDPEPVDGQPTISPPPVERVESWLPNTNQQIFKDTWKENLAKSIINEHWPNDSWGQHSHKDGSTHLGIPKEPYKPTRKIITVDDITDWLESLWNTGIYDWKPLEGEPIPSTTDEQLIEAMMVLSEDKKEAWNPFPESWWKPEPKKEPTLGSPMKPLHKYKV